MRSQKLKIWIAVLTALVLVAAGTGAVYAYLSASSGPADNTFTLEDSVNPAINAYTVNVGDTGYAVYVRVAVIVTWQNASDEIYGQMPIEGTDYQIYWNVGEGEDWFSDGVFYYYRDRVASNGSTTALLNDYSLISSNNVPEGYTLHVEIISQTIQADGTTDDGDVPAVTNAWGVTVDSDKKLTH